MIHGSLGNGPLLAQLAYQGPGRQRGTCRNLLQKMRPAVAQVDSGLNAHVIAWLLLQ